MSKKRYLITLWIEWYDYNENILQKFSIEYETADLDGANRKLDKIVKETLNEGLKEFEDFAIKKISTSRRPILVNVNKNNKVIRKERRKIGDGSGYNYIYYDFDIIEIPAEKNVDENLFNLKNCEQAVKSFFQFKDKQYQKDASPEKRFIGIKELAKSKPLSSSLSSWLKK